MQVLDLSEASKGAAQLDEQSISTPRTGAKRRSARVAKAQFIGATTFWNMLINFRVLKFDGRYGGGKTSAAFLCGARLMAEGHCEHVISNIPGSFVSTVENLHRPSTIILDESWIYIESSKDVKDYAGFVRKFNHYLLLPSVFDISTRLSMFTVQRIFNAYSLGLPAWWYRWNLRSKSVKESGTFGILHPRSIFGHYPTNFVAGDDGGISEQLLELSKKSGFKGTRREQKRASVVVDIEEDTAFDDDLATIAADMEDVGHEFSQGVEDMEKISKAIQRNARRSLIG